MPPNAALIICAFFVLWLLLLDHKQAPKVSFALWLPTIWMLVNASKPLGAWFQSYGAKTVEEGSRLDQIYLFILLCIGLIVLSGRKFNWYNTLCRNFWMLLLILYMLVSVLWSDIPIVSFKRWTREFIALVMIFIVISESEPRQAFQSLLRRIIYILIPFSYVLINYFPEYGREYHIWEGNVMWIGVATQKNGLGIICLITIFYLVWSFIRRKQGRDIPATGYQTYLEVFILILTLWLMGGPKHNLSFSVASNVSLLLGLFTLIAYSWIKKIDGVMSSKALLVIVAMIISYGTITPFVGKLYVADISSSFGRDTTLTGRDEIWADLVKQAMQRPFFGYGFGGFWTSKAIEEARIASAHNGYLEIILNIGFIGHMIFFILLLSCCLKAQREIVENSDWGICALCYLLMAVVHNMVESSCAGITGKIFVVALLLAVSPIANPLYIRTGGRKVSRNTMRNKLRHTFAKNIQVSHNSYTI